MKNEIYPCLWFDGKAKEAADFYCSVFNNSKILAETPMVVTFESSGQKFMCLNGGPEFSFNPSVSFFVLCETKEEIDKLWNSLIADGEELMAIDKYGWSERYGWVEDRFGISWQLMLGSLSDVGKKFSPLLMFSGDKRGKTEEAIKFYASVFDNSSVDGIVKYDPGESDITGAVKHAQFKLNNNNVFMAMDSHMENDIRFNEAISFVVECDTQNEIDYFWGKLTQGGEESMCGWLKDKYGLSWQIIPSILENLLNDPDKSQRVVDAFMQMRKFDIEKLLVAAEETEAVHNK